MDKIINFFKNLFKLLTSVQKEDEPIIEQPETPVSTTPSEPTNSEVPTPTKPITPMEITPREKLYNVAKSYLDKDASPSDIANDELACMESVDTITFKTFGKYINGNKVTVSTAEGYKILSTHPSYQKVTTPQFGDIIISPTGYGNGNLSNGHTGIVAKSGVMSNDSATGLWKVNYTLDTWNKRYKVLGGFPVVFFRRIKN